MTIESDGRRSVDLRGLSLAEAEAKVRELIDASAEEALADFEIAMTDFGADPDEIAAELVRARAQNAQAREEVMERMAAWVARDGHELQ